METTYGSRIAWPTRQFHWEIRRGFTVENYSSRQFNNFLEAIKKEEKNYAKKFTVFDLDDYFEGLYKVSCLDLLNLRLGFYKDIYPPSSYRRTSENFNMQGNQDAKIGAFVRNSEPEVVWINDGMVLAIEDAAQTLLAVVTNPIGIQLDEAQLLPLRLVTQGHKNSFLDYTSIIAQERARNNATPPSSYVPQIVSNSSFCLSRDLSRQIFAENLSTISLLWVISHEDAHKYSGHLKHFQNLGISEQDLLFSELISTVTDTNNTAARKAAELEADTCAAMRAVDYCFDCNFLEVITDSIPSDAFKQVWEGQKRSNGLRERQRLFLLRLISLGAILPLIIFECSLKDNSLTNLDCYPSFSIRVLNIIFVVASRAMDISMSKHDNSVGQIGFNELKEFFACAIHDVLIASHVLTTSQGPGISDERLQSELGNYTAVSSALMIAFLAAHGQSHMLGLSHVIKPDTFGSEGQIVVDLIKERHQMHRSSLERFADAKREVNPSRTKKIIEDHKLAKNLIDVAKDAFSFV